MTRIEAARRRVAGAKQIAVAVAAAGFLATLLLVRGTHLGHAATASSSTSGSGSSSSTQSSGGSLGFGSSSVAPSSGSTSTPQAQTSVS
jgi:hypothetical protein